MADPQEADKKVTLLFTEKEHEALKVEAVMRHMTMSQIVREALHRRVMIIDRSNKENDK